MTDRSYTGFVRPTEESWQATCADLDIVVHGQSFDEVYGKLVSAVSGQVANGGDPDSGRGPFQSRITTRWGWLLAWATRSGPQEDGSFRVHARVV